MFAWLTVEVAAACCSEGNRPPTPSHFGRGTTAFAAMLARHVGLDPRAGPTFWSVNGFLRAVPIVDVRVFALLGIVLPKNCPTKSPFCRGERSELALRQAILEGVNVAEPILVTSTHTKSQRFALVLQKKRKKYST